jgi:membrane-associated phospholipid phosphatase
MKNNILIFLLLIFSTSVIAQNADIDILKSINVGRDKKLDETFKTLTNSAAPVSIAIPVGLITAGLIKHDSITTNKGICISASLLLAAGISTGLKYAVNRPRPFVTYPFIDKATSAGSPSFPSGHTSDAFATATAISLAYQKWYVVAPSYLWACSVGYSRMHLGVHYPSDVLAGAIIGSGTSFLCYKANRWLHKHKR